MFKEFNIAVLLAVVGLAHGQSITTVKTNDYSSFIGLDNFSNFTQSSGTNGETVLMSPAIEAKIDWNALIVSWNVAAPAGSYLNVDARVIRYGHNTKFYSMGHWSLDNQAFLRASVSGQKDFDGDVATDTLNLNEPANIVQIRLTLGGTNGSLPTLKFLGLSFSNTKIAPAILPPNKTAWGKIIPTIERSQQSYEGGGGWCSPTSLSMALTRWSTVTGRGDWSFDVPEVAAGVRDSNFKKATGNWSFNTAFAGSLPGMRSYVTRLSDISELEDWIAVGIPVIISARWDLLKDGRPDDFNGHLTICHGFTENGDLVINDPWTDLKVERVQHIYKRENVIRAWATSHNTVYLIFPENTKLPTDRFGHW